MEHTRNAMERLKIIGDRTDALNRFLEQWFNEQDYIEARTSGSTGKPKDIFLKKTDMILSAARTCEFLGITRGGTMALSLSADYIAGKMMVVRALYSDATLIVEKPSNLPLSNDVGQPIDLLAIVPSQVDGFLKSSSGKYVKNVLIGGAPLDSSTEQRLVMQNVNAYVTYGMTETCSHIALRKVGMPYYNTLPGVSIDVDDRSCLSIFCDGFSFGKIQTNDVVELIDSHSFKWLGRADNVINSGGIKIYPESVEEKISTIFPDLTCYVTHAKSEKWGEEVVLMVESESEIPDLKEHLTTVLSHYELPKHIIYRSLFSRTGTGKIIRESFQ